MAGPVVEAEDRAKVRVLVGRRVGRAGLAVEDVAPHVELGSEELLPGRIEDEELHRPRLAAHEALEATRPRAVLLVGNRKRGDAGPARLLELRLGRPLRGGGWGSQGHCGERSGKQACDYGGATHSSPPLVGSTDDESLP